MPRPFRLARSATVLLLALPLAGCAGMGALDGVLAGLPGTSLSGEVRRVDARRQEIRVRTAHGRDETVDYDRRTQVVRGRERASVRALQPGDEVSMQVRRDGRGDLYADYIRVERSARGRQASRYPDRVDDRGRRHERTATLQGRVARVDPRQGWFQLRAGSRDRYVVTLPRGADRSLVQRFQRLRDGQSVRVEARPLGRGRAELVRFR